MRYYQFKVSIPIENGCKEVILNKKEEVCSLLDISENTFNSLKSGRLTMKHESKKHLAGIKIETIMIESKRKSKIQIDEEAKEKKIAFQAKILGKIAAMK